MLPMPIWRAIVARSSSGTDLHVLRIDGFGEPTGLARSRENHLEVKLLRGAHDVRDPVCSEVIHAVANRREIGRRVTVAAVGLTNDERKRLLVAARESSREYAQSAIRDTRDPCLLEVIAHARERVVIGRFAREVLIGEGHVEHVVDAVEVLLREPHEPRPHRERCLVARLQGRDSCTRALREIGLLRICIEFRACRLVERVRVGLEKFRLFRILAHFKQVFNEHAERRAPVADVVLAHNLVAFELEHACERIAHDRRAQVANVHFFRDVRRRVVDDDRLWLIGGRDAKALILVKPSRLGGDPFGLERDVEEARSGNLGRLRDVVKLDVVKNLLGKVPRLRAELLREAHRRVALEVRELPRPDNRVSCAVFLAESLGEGILETFSEGKFRCSHTPSLRRQAEPGHAGRGLGRDGFVTQAARGPLRRLRRLLTQLRRLRLVGGAARFFCVAMWIEMARLVLSALACSERQRNSCGEDCRRGAGDEQC